MLQNIIISIFSIYGLTSGSNRILLQGPGQPITPPIPPPHCPEQSQTCPDGTFVFREPPSCEFTPCPPEIPPIPGVPPNNPSIPEPVPVPEPAVPVNPPNNPPPVTNPDPAVPALPAPPAGFEYGAYGQLCQITPTASSNICQSTQDIATDAHTGSVQCSAESDCCMCSAIECGLGTTPCSALRVGASGAYGVGDIQVIGADTGIGAIIDCSGAESCLAAAMYAENVAEIICSGISSCEDGYIVLIDPKPDFTLDCSGAGSCNRLRIEISFTAPTAECEHILDPTVPKKLFYIGGVECANDMSCQDLDITIVNNGCDTVIIDEIVCLHRTGCDAARFTFIGDVDVVNCQCGPSCDNAIGLDKCYENLEKLECSDPESCKGRSATFYNPVNYFESKCGNTQSCADANLQFVLNQDITKPAPIVDWKGFVFGGEMAAIDATFTILNEQGLDATGSPITLNVEMIECGGIQACRGTTFIKGQNVVIHKIMCKPGSCVGCTIKDTITGPGHPCDPTQGAIIDPPQVPGVNIPPSGNVAAPQIPPPPQGPIIIPPTNPSNPTNPIIDPWQPPQIPPPMVIVPANPANPQPQAPTNPSNPAFPWEAPQIPQIPQPQPPQPQVPVVNTPQIPINPAPQFPWEQPQAPQPQIPQPQMPQPQIPQPQIPQPQIPQPQMPQPQVPVVNAPQTPSNPTNPANPAPVFPWEQPQIPQPQIPQPQVPVVNVPQTPSNPTNPSNPAAPQFPWLQPGVPIR